MQCDGCRLLLRDWKRGSFARTRPPRPLDLDVSWPIGDLCQVPRRVHRRSGPAARPFNIPAARTAELQTGCLTSRLPTLPPQSAHPVQPPPPRLAAGGSRSRSLSLPLEPKSLRTHAGKGRAGSAGWVFFLDRNLSENSSRRAFSCLVPLSPNVGMNSRGTRVPPKIGWDLRHTGFFNEREYRQSVVFD